MMEVGSGAGERERLQELLPQDADGWADSRQGRTAHGETVVGSGISFADEDRVAKGGVCIGEMSEQVVNVAVNTSRTIRRLAGEKVGIDAYVRHR
jgi:hypothetical protein